MEKVVVKNSIWKYLLMAIFTLAFAAINIDLFVSAGELNERLIVGFFAPVFLIGFLLFAYQIVFPRPRLIIDEFGIYDKLLGVGEIEWHDIDNIYLDSDGKTKQVSLVLKDTDKYISRLPESNRKMRFIESSTGLNIVALDLRGLDKNAQEVFDLLVVQLKTHRIKDLRKLGTPKLFERNSI